MTLRLPVLVAAFVLVCSPFATAQGTKEVVDAVKKAATVKK